LKHNSLTLTPEYSGLLSRCLLAGARFHRVYARPVGVLYLC
jgi:hypothetical protein